MKGGWGLRLLLTCFLLTFACVLLSGAGRLLGGEEPRQAAGPRPVCAALGSGVQLESVVGASPAGAEGLRRAAQEAVRRESAACPPVALTDANGNVLRGESYLRTVYSAFALGDGFA